MRGGQEEPGIASETCTFLELGEWQREQSGPQS